MSPSTPPPDSNPDDLRFEAAAQELESIISRIEGGEIELEDSLEAYRRGLALVKRCTAILDAAQQAIQELSVEDLEGTAEANAKESD